MRKYVLAGLLIACSSLHAQSVPAAEGPRHSLWVGAEASRFNPDWACTSSSPFTCGGNQLIGVAAFADLNRMFGRVGLEGEARWLYWGGPSYNLTETSYLVGPRVQVYASRRFSFNAKVLAGGATINQLEPSWGGWAAFAPGGTVGYRIAPRWIVRGDYEYQIWPHFADNGLTPNGFSVGLSYRLLR